MAKICLKNDIFKYPKYFYLKLKFILLFLLINLIRFYQFIISPFLGCHCRFFPSCSQYTLEALRTYGIFQGLYLSTMRILRCQPFCKGGIDFLPIKKHPHSLLEKF